MRRRCPPLAIAFALTLILLAGCRPSGGVKGPDVRDLPDVLGTWTWTGSTGGIGGIDKTPENSGERWSIEFRADGSYREVRDGEEHVGRFAIQERQSIFDHEQRPALVIEGRSDAIIGRPDPDRLTLSDNVYDGFNSSFTRAR